MNPKSRIWIVSELYYPELTSTGYYLTAISESLASDMDVHVICGQPNYGARGTREPRRALHKGVYINRVRGLRLDKNILGFRLLNMLSLCAAVLLKSIRSFRKGDSVLIATTPPLLPFIAATASLTRGAAYTLLVHDVYPEQLIATGILGKDSVVASLIDISNRWVYKHASRIIVVGRDMRELLDRKSKGLGIDISYIPNWGDADNIRPEPPEGNQLLAQLELQGKFIVLSAGNLGRPNDLETIIAAAELLSENDRVHFLFIGGGARRKWLEKRSFRLPNVTILQPMPRELENVFLNAGTVTVASLIPGMRGAGVPSRIYNYLAAGKPVIAICEIDSEMARVVREEQAGYRIDPGDANALTRCIEELMGSPRIRVQMGRKARSAAVSKYAPKKLLSCYRDLLARNQ